MALTTSSSEEREIYELLRASNWAAVTEFYETGLDRKGRERAELRLPVAIAYLRDGRTKKGLKFLDRAVLALPNARSDLRRFVVSPLVAEQQLEIAQTLLDRLLEVGAGSIEDRRLRASIRGRLKQWDGALEDAQAVLDALPADPSAQRAFIQLLLQSGRVDEAGRLASGIGLGAASDFRLANIALLAMSRSGRQDEAADLALAMADSEIPDENAAAVIVRSLAAAGRVDQAIEVGERLLEEGWDHELLRSSLADSYVQSRFEDRYERTIRHLEAGLDMAPDDVRMNMTMGEALLRSRRYNEALPHLDKACKLQPKGAQQRALYARALKQVGQYSDAADQFTKLLELQPSSARWARYAAGALSQAGRKAEASQIFDKFVGSRRSTLPSRFEDGLEALWSKTDTASIPKPRLDWAWALSNERPNDRTEWERRAKWGHLADHYMLDWLECREQRIHDAMERLADLDEAEKALAEINTGGAMILASAHIGPMYAGPLALELLGVQSRWLASTPSVAKTAYASSLISTSEQDDMEVAKAFMLSLRKGFSVVIAVDGAINLAAPRVPFEGQEITYSSFAARTAFRMEVPSAFAAPKWNNGRIEFFIRKLPDPEAGESADDHAERWRKAYLAALREYLGGPPENLRLSGGIWRHIF